MTSKQKTAIAALVCAAIVAVSAMFAPGLKCEPDPKLIEDALGGSGGPGSDVPAEQPAAPAESASSGPAAGSSESSGSTGA